MLVNIYAVLRSPQKAFVRITEQQCLWKAFCVQLCIFVTNILVEKNGTEISFGEQILYLIVGIPLMLFVWCLSAGIIHGVAHLMGGCGTWKKQLIAVSYSLLPELVFVPLQVAVLWLGLADIFMSALAIVSCIWCLMLSVYGVKVVQKLSTAKSVLVVLMPSIVVVVLGVLFCLMMIAVRF